MDIEPQRSSTLSLITRMLVDYSAQLRDLSLANLLAFVDLIRHMKERIEWNQPTCVVGPPEGLPESVHNFVRDALRVDDDVIKILWDGLRDTIWYDMEAVDGENKTATLLPLFLKYGLPYGISALFFVVNVHYLNAVPGFYEFFPPRRTCMDPNCRKKDRNTGEFVSPELTDSSTYAATMLTKVYGALPVYTTSFYCRSK